MRKDIFTNLHELAKEILSIPCDTIACETQCPLCIMIDGKYYCISTQVKNTLNRLGDNE